MSDTVAVKTDIEVILAQKVTDKMTLIGRVITLMLDSSVYLVDTLYDIKKNLIGPIYKDQALILVRKGKVVAYCSWAFLNEETEQRYIDDSNSLEVSDWNAGDRIWLVDVVAPFGDARHLLRAVRDIGELKGLKGQTIKFKSYEDANTFQIREVTL